MSKSNEIITILNNIKKYSILFITLNLIILSSFIYFYEQTKDIKSEYAPIKFVTNDFPTLTNISESVKFYIEFTTDYTFDVDNKIFMSNENSNINLEILKKKLDKYIEDYHANLKDLANQIKNNEQEYQVLSQINYYFSKINLFDKVYKFDEIYSNYKYDKINYLTIIFSLFIFLNFSLYIFILSLQSINKKK